MYRCLRNLVTRSIRYSKATHTRKILQENIDRPEKFWEKNQQNIKLFQIKGEQTTDLKAVSNEPCKCSANVGKTLQWAIPNLSNNVWKLHDYRIVKQIVNPKNYSFHFKPTSRNEVKSILKKIKRETSPGYDDIPTCMVVDGADEIATPLSVLINRCLETSDFPSEVKVAKITSIYKSGDRSSMEKYRPISVLPVL